MTDLKVKPSHLSRQAFIYVRQSSISQVEHNRESTARQYALADRAQQLGGPKNNIVIIDDDLALSGATTNKRSGFTHMLSGVALGNAGMILGLEVSRLARNNADWYRLLELCGLIDTLIADADGVYHPALFNDRLLLGLKGTMSEAELHIIRARLDGGIRNKAARGELRRGLPVGLVWGDAEGEVLFHPNEAVVAAIRSVFERFAEFGSARRVWLWLRSEAPSFPLQDGPEGQIGWVVPTYTAIRPFKVSSFTPFQVSVINLDEFIQKRRDFTTEEWMEVLVNSCGLDPTRMTRRQRLLFCAGACRW